MKLREGTGSLNCRICDASFQMPIHHLHEPIDVFSEWLDACEAAEKGSQGVQGVENDVDDRGLGFSSLSNRDGRSSDNVDDAGQKQTYAALGLDESDDDSE